MDNDKKKRKEKIYIVYQNPEKCSFHRIPGFIVAMATVGGGVYCAFFDDGLHTEESIKKNKRAIKLHSIYSCG